MVICNRNRIKLTDRAFAIQHARRIFPGHCTAGFHLGPADFRTIPLAKPAFGHEIVNPALAVLIAGIPVLHGRIFDLGIFQGDQFDHGGMQLVFIAHRRGASLEIGYVAAFFSNDQRTLKLAGVFGVDAEIGRQFHRAAHAFGNVNKGAVGKDRAVEGGKIIVMHRHDFAQPSFDELGIFLDRLGDGAENHSRLLQLLAECGGHANAVKHRIHRHFARAFDPGQHFLFGQRNAELVINAFDLGIELVERGQFRLRLGRRIIIGVLIIDRRVADFGPIRLFHGLPQAERFEPPFEHPFRLFLLGRDKPHGVFIETLGRKFGINVGRPAMFVISRFGRRLMRCCVLQGFVRLCLIFKVHRLVHAISFVGCSESAR